MNTQELISLSPMTYGTRGFLEYTRMRSWSEAFHSRKKSIQGSSLKITLRPESSTILSAASGKGLNPTHLTTNRINVPLHAFIMGFRFEFGNKSIPFRSFEAHGTFNWGS